MGYHAPDRLQTAFDLLDRPGVSVIAGGTDWFPANGQLAHGKDLVDVTRLPGFRGIFADPLGWRIGAATRWSDITQADLPPAFEGLQTAARQVGALQVQNAGTIGGNLCNASPAADGVPPLLTLEAQVELTSRRGSRVLALGDFLKGPRQTVLAPGELVSAILIPPLPGQAVAGFEKLGARKYMVISVAMVAVLLIARKGLISEARIAVGACSPVAMRLPMLEADLTGAPLKAAAGLVRPEHLARLSPLTDMRGTATYRSEAVAELIRRALARAGHAHD